MNHPPIPLDHHCSVIYYESAGIWALEKASGVLTHPNKEAGKGKRSRTLLNADYLQDEECYAWKNEEGVMQKLYLVHRLDSPTSGVILASSNLRIADMIKELFLNKEIRIMERLFKRKTRRWKNKSLEGEWFTCPYQSFC
jgi:tRNA pseudouridine65 synthase